ncbi:hypothetical protein LSTR_LSTR004961 [Laodelphax striatellus]|uniref:Uncharacterized protein n=1 Tax=Laodelphax striatellus TaxID=195883 RepID=A0A482XN51_LAOST|nr:hypothetical protein LSTR_LSTR004961 [Laodelphax striatellus]
MTLSCGEQCHKAMLAAENLLLGNGKFNTTLCDTSYLLIVDRLDVSATCLRACVSLATPASFAAPGGGRFHAQLSRVSHATRSRALSCRPSGIFHSVDSSVFN